MTFAGNGTTSKTARWEDDMYSSRVQRDDWAMKNLSGILQRIDLELLTPFVMVVCYMNSIIRIRSPQASCLVTMGVQRRRTLVLNLASR